MAKYKYTSWVTAFLVGLGILGYKPVEKAFTATPFNKNLTLVIYKENSYTAEAYDYSSAQVHVIVERIKGGDRRIELDTTFDRKLLREYPEAENAFIQNIVVSNVLADKETIEVKCILTYCSDNNCLQMQDGLVLEGENEQLKIGI